MIGEVLSFGYDQCAKLGYGYGIWSNGRISYISWAFSHNCIEAF